MPVFSASLGRVLHLGRIRPEVLKPVRKLTEFIRATLPAPPATLDLQAKASKNPMYANDRYGCCVFSCIGHQIGTYTGNESNDERIFTDGEILAMYSAVTGFDPRRPNTDNGAIITEALDYWIRSGLAGDRLAGYVGVDSGSTRDVMLGAWLFGGLHLGISMPAAWQQNTGPGLKWDVGPNQRGQWEPGSWGGHAVPVVRYDTTGVDVVTWGGVQRITWAGFHTYVDESYACASWDWCVDNETPTGILKADMVRYFAEMGGGTITPPIPPLPPPPPPPVGTGVIHLDLESRTFTVPPGWTPAGPPNPTARRMG